MAAIRMHVFLGIALCMLPAALAHAATVDATSHVTEATIYTDRALVTRAAKIHVVAGTQTVSIADMPAGLNEATLRVQGKASVPVKIGTVELKHIYLTELANAAERDKQAQIEARGNDKALLQGEIDALKAKQDFITRVASAGVVKQDAGGNAKIDFTPEKWQQAWNLVQTGMAEAEKDIALKNIAMKKIDADIARLQQEVAQAHSQQARERREAHVNIEASADTDLDLTLTYQTAGAAWNPVYDARLDTGAGQVQLEQYGSVRQNTGEDWNDIALTLSTAQPASGSEMPQIVEWWVGLFQPIVKAKNAMAYSRMELASADSVSMGAPAASSPSLPAPMAAEPVAAIAATTEYSAEFKVPGHVELKSAQDATKLFIGAVRMKAALMAETTPRLGAQAYLFAKATNNETYPLIPGLVAKYRDGAFIGNASLPLVRPNEEAHFAFGVDDRLKVEYKPIKETKDNPALIVVGDITDERQYQIKVQNLHKEPMTVTVLEQYPVSQDPDVKVTLIDDATTPGYEPDKERRQNVVAWTDSYKPQEEKTYTLGFRVKYPKGRMIQGM